MLESDTRVKAILPELRSVDLLNDVYKIKMRVISKIAIGHSCEESWAAISKTDKGFLVNIENYKTYACNPDGTSIGDFTAADAQMLTNLSAYCDVAQTAANKLKSKKWYNEHPIEGLPVSGKYYFWGIDESKTPGFAYELNFAFFDKNMKPYFFSVLSNNDSYIDLKEDTAVNINGVIRSVSYSDFGNEYKVSKIVIEER